MRRSVTMVNEWFTWLWRGARSADLAFPRLWQAIGWVMVLVVVFGTLMSDPPELPPVLGVDKVLHGLAYAGLMWWFRQAFARRPAWVIFLLGLGAVLELCQGGVRGRGFEYGDMAANGAGVIIGLIVARTAAGTIVTRFDRVARRITHAVRKKKPRK